MIEAYEIGIRLALDDGVTAGVDAIRRDLAELNLAVGASLGNLARLREAAAAVVAPMAPEAARPSIQPLERAAEAFEPVGPAAASAAVVAALHVPPDAPVAAAPVQASSPEAVRPVAEAPATASGPESAPPQAAVPAARQRADETSAPEAGATALIPVVPARPVSPTATKPDPEPVIRPLAPSFGSVAGPWPMEPPRVRVSAAEPAAPAPVRKLPSEPPPERPVARLPPPDRPQANGSAPRIERRDSVVGDPWPSPPAISPTAPTSLRTQAEAPPLAASPAASAFAPVPSRSPPPSAASAPVTRRPDATTPESTPPRQGQPDQDGMNVHLYLDGALLGRWMSGHLGRAASRPSTSSTAFDPRIGPTWPGAPIG